MSFVIAGGAGFIGSRLAEKMVSAGESALILDNLCRGSRAYLAPLEKSGRVTFMEVNLADQTATREAIERYAKEHPVEAVWHLAANSDIPAGISDASVDLRDTFMTTYSLLQAMKALGIPRLAFASSSAIYGEFPPEVALREDIGPLMPISNYGAMKLASEAAICAAAASWLERAMIFRFPNVVGTPATHGVILDFVRKLKASPDRLAVLGNGSQQKVYLHVEDLIDAMLFIMKNAPGRLDIYNIGPSDAGCRVSQIAEMVVEAVSPEARIEYGSADRGWVGDVPRFRYSVDKLGKLGWQPGMNSVQAVKKAIAEIVAREKLS